MVFEKRVVHKMCKEDLKVSECGLGYHTPEHFTICFWQNEVRVRPEWLAYRIIMALYFLITCPLTIMHVGREVNDEDRFKYGIYLTNWTYVLETHHFICAMVVVLRRYIKERSSDFNPEIGMEKMPCYYKWYWITHTIVVSASFCVTCIFWVVIYDPEYNPLDFINFTTHVFNSLFMVIDFFLVGHPFRLWHVYLPNVYAVLYMLFSLIYQRSGGTGSEGKIPIYEILDWEKPGRTIVCCLLSQLFLVFVHILFWSLYKVKVVVKKNVSNSSGGKTQKEGIENLGMDMRII